MTHFPFPLSTMFYACIIVQNLILSMKMLNNPGDITHIHVADQHSLENIPIPLCLPSHVSYFIKSLLPLSSEQMSTCLINRLHLSYICLINLVVCFTQVDFFAHVHLIFSIFTSFRHFVFTYYSFPDTISYSWVERLITY